MLNFCTNCGHQNDQINKVCVECGTALVKEKPKAAPAAKKPKKPIPFKTKVIASIAAVLLAAFAGFYSWGTNAASPESAVSNFFEALQDKDAKALTKVVALTNRSTISEKEAEAFISLYSDLTPMELESMAAIEKNGKLAGVIDTHKIILTPQKVAVPYSFEELELTLNGESVTGKVDQDGDTVFSDITPGLYDAELSVSSEFTEFSYPFELQVTQQSDPSSISYIQEDFPVGLVDINVPFTEDNSTEGIKVIVGDKEVPLNEYFSTGRIGPLPLDGSVEAKLEVTQSWGTAESESVPIDSTYMFIEGLIVPEELKAELGERYVEFTEEYFLYLSKRDLSLITTILPEYQEEVFYEITDWLDSGMNFTGTLEEVIYDNDSFSFSDDGKKVEFDVTRITNHAFYESGETPEPEIEENSFEVEFTYDENTSSWLLSDSYSAWSSYSFSSPVTLEGSDTVYNSTTVSAETVSEEETTTLVDEEEINENSNDEEAEESSPVEESDDNQSEDENLPSLTYSTADGGKTLILEFHNLGSYTPFELEMIDSQLIETAIVNSDGTISPANVEDIVSSWQSVDGHIEYWYHNYQYGSDTEARVTLFAPGKEPITLSVFYKVP